MKKSYFFIAIIIGIAIVIFGCFYLKKQKADNNTTNTTVPSVEEMVASDSLTIDSIWKAEKDSLNPDSITSNWVHFETCIELSWEVDTAPVPSVSRLIDIYQISRSNRITNETNTDVYRIIHDTDGKTYTDVARNAFWLEDNPLIDSDVQVTFSQAYDRLQKANCVKPHSRFVTLRNAIGPHPSNPQWIFGNASCGIVFVDCVNGNVTTSNPVYSK